MSLFSTLTSFVRSAVRNPAVRRGARDLSRAAVRAARDQRRGGHRTPAQSRRGATDSRPAPGSDQSDDAREIPRGGDAEVLADRIGDIAPSLDYAPRSDERPDPGEVVWAWVHFEEDMAQGKDRPVLVIAEEAASAGGPDGSGEVLIALMLTSRDRVDSNTVSTDEHGATWVDIGSGEWDRKGRPSEVRADRLLRLVPSTVRREGGRLDRARFDRVASAVREVHGWS